MRRLLIPIYPLILLFSFACAPPAERRTIYRDLPLSEDEATGLDMVGGRPLLWPMASLPIHFAFGTGTPDWIRDACREAGTTFNTAAGHTLFTFDPGEVAIPKDFRAASGPNLVTYGQALAERQDKIGSTRTLYFGSRIAAVRIDFDPALGTARESWWRYVDPVSACLHELGHALGFTHRKDPGSIMFPREEMHLRALSADDKARVVRYYGLNSFR